MLIQFVVDGNWVTDHTAPQENDASGNLNNVLTIDRIVKHKPETAGIMSGVTPTSTTADLAKDAPLEHEKAPLEHTGSSELPGAFPETPAAEKGDFSVNPLPAAAGAVNPITLAPGEKVPHPSTFTSNTITSGVHDDPELVAADKAKKEGEQAFSVSPLPAFAGGVNPIQSVPGEKLPHSDSLTTNTIGSSVTTDKESYEKSGGLGNSPLPATSNGSAGTSDLPAAKNLIPESSLPMGAAGLGTFDATPTIQSAGPTSTTAELAAAVPLESSKVPEVVKESQEKAGVDPEASAVPAEVSEKSAVEKELLAETPVAPSTSEGTAGKGTDKSEKAVTAGEAATAVGASALAVGGAAFAYASKSASNAASSLPPSVTSKLPESVTSQLPESVQKSISSMNTTSGISSAVTAKDTPAIVKESIAESGQAPEAAANEEAVLEKKAVEKELLSEIKPETSTGESAPKIGATGTAPIVAATSTTNASASSAAVAKDTPAVVKESIAQSGQGPEAAANEEAVLEKKAVEKELLSEIKPETSTGESAPKISSASTPAAASAPKIADTKKDNLTAPVSSGLDSRDVSPGTVPGSHTQNQTAPTVTTGVASATTDKTSSASPATPAKSTTDGPSTPSKSTPTKPVDSPSSSAAGDKKKKNRRSIFGKIKDKLSHKD